MIERIMLYVAPGPTGDAAARWALALARRLGARVFACHAVDPALVPDGPGRPARLEELEEEAWKILYEVEDDAFELDVKLSLVLEQGNPVEMLTGLVASYSGDLVVVPAGSLRPADLVARTPAPVVTVRSFKEEE